MCAVQVSGVALALTMISVIRLIREIRDIFSPLKETDRNLSLRLGLEFFKIGV